jgi:hypothetical protein
VETAATIIGILIVVVALAGFVRSLWRPPGRGSDGAERTLSDQTVDSGSHSGGGHGGADGGSG